MSVQQKPLNLAELTGEAGSIDREAGETLPRFKNIKSYESYRNLPLGLDFQF